MISATSSDCPSEPHAMSSEADDDMREALREETHGRRPRDGRVRFAADASARGSPLAWTSPEPSPVPALAVRKPYNGPHARCAHCGRTYPTVAWSGALIVHYMDGTQCNGKRSLEP